MIKKILLTGIRKFEIADVEKPHIINGDDVLLKVQSVGVCGSDMHYYNEGRIGDQVVEYPFTIGHECSAIVDEIGKRVSSLKSGSLVAVEPALSCHQCEQCLSGREHTCTHQKFLGCPGQIDGCLAEYIVMPARNCFPVPSIIDAEMAALVEPLSIGFYAASFAEFYRPSQFDINIAILGVGPIGLSVLLSLQTMGYKNIFVTDKLDYRIAAAKKADAIILGNPDSDDILYLSRNIHKDGFDIVFECCGKQEAIDQAVDILKPGGALILVGIPAEDRISFNISRMRRKEITFQNVRRQNKSIQPVIDLTTAQKWSPEFMITHHFKVDETAEAFKLVDAYADNVIKAMITF